VSEFADPLPDGLHLPQLLVFQGRTARVAMCAVPLLGRMLRRGPVAGLGVAEAEILEAEYDNAPSSLKPHCHLANKGLATVGHPLRLARRSPGPRLGVHITWLPSEEMRSGVRVRRPDRR
jgi:hypothetical protein